jgi:uncharacterized protein (TIRG00374 family)
MNKKRILGTGTVVVILGLLIYLQVRAWKTFEWSKFWNRTEHVNWFYVLLSVAIIYFVYVLRAVRWEMFLKPVRKTTTSRLLAPQFIGFAGLALLGRPGEMIRPYLVARKENLTFSSQVAVWLVERIFDMGSVAVIFVVEGFVGDSLWSALGIRNLQKKVEWSAELFLAGIVAFAVCAVLLRLSGEPIARYLQRKLERYSSKIATAVSSKILAFTQGLKTISDFTSFLQLFFLSLVMWLLVALSYWLVVHSYGGTLAELGPASIVLLMIAAMFGSLIQLPGVGGGSQLATIAVLNKVFGIENELAVSCGMLIWVATFMSVIPMGLLLAQREHVSLRAVAAEEEKEEEALKE